MAGGSPLWKVPWVEIIRNHSYETLERIYTGYGEKGPSQALLWKADALSMVKEKYPEIDYVNSCRIVDRDTGTKYFSLVNGGQCEHAPKYLLGALAADSAFYISALGCYRGRSSLREDQP